MFRMTFHLDILGGVGSGADFAIICGLLFDMSFASFASFRKMQIF